MWTFKSRKIKDKDFSYGDHPIDGREYLIFHSFSVEPVKGVYCKSSDSYILTGNCGLTVNKKDYKIIREVYMNNEKLMKIVQAVNDSRGEPEDISNRSYRFIAKYIGLVAYETGSIHALSYEESNNHWQYICTVEEFNQCVKEMSAGHGEKGSGMNSKHPHHDLIVEWAKDTSKVIEMKNASGEFASNIRLGINNVINDSTGLYEFRFKPREFVKGHWYPCAFKSHDKGTGYPMVFNGSGFINHKRDEHPVSEINFRFIGESLGEINFGGGE